LVINNNNLTAFPQQSSAQFKMQFVTSIDLSHNSFEVLDKSFAAFPRLQVLNISHNKLREIDSAVSVLTAMHTLDMSYNELEMVHEKLGSCVSLQTLILHHNKMVDFPAAIPHLMNLKTLDMRENKLINPRPTYFNTLLKLTDMNLSHNNIDTLVGSLFALSKLQNLDMSHNSVRIMPDLFGKLTSLQTLDLSYNRVEGITPTVSNLQKLDRMELRDNCIDEVPIAITKMKSLRRIDLINNLLPDYSEVLRSMTQLRGWNLSGNKISGEYGTFLKNTDESSMASANDESGGNDQPVKVEFLIRKSRKMWDDLENIITAQAVGKVESSVHHDASTILTADDGNSTVATGFPWLKELQHWSSDLDESIQALSTIKAPTGTRGADVASAMRTLMVHPECRLMMAKIADDSSYRRPYEHHIFTQDVLRILDLGQSYVNCIRDFESLGATLFYVSKSQREEELAHLRQQKGTDGYEEDAKKPVIMRSATMATVEEVEAEMDRRIADLVESSRERATASRDSKRSASTREFSARGDKLGGLDGTDRPSKSDAGLSTGALRMMREMSVSESPANSARDASEQEEDKEDKGSNSTASNQEGEDEVEVEKSSPMKSDLSHECAKDDNSLRNLAVGDILEDSEFGSPSRPLHSPPFSPPKPRLKGAAVWKTLELLYDPAFGNPTNSLLFKVAFECYYGLGLALVERADRLTADIRRIEQNCGLISKLDVGQRKGDDMRDILIGYEQHFPKKSGSTGSTATLKMPSLFSLSDMASVTSLESDEMMGEGGAEETSVPAGGVAAPSQRSPSLTSTALEDPDDTFLKSLYTTHATALVKSLMRERSKLYLWAVLVLGCAADLLHLYGWDAVNDYAVENVDNTVLLAGKDLRSAAVGMCLAYSRALQGAEMHALALAEINKVLRLSPQFRTAEVMRLRSMCVLGDFPEAKKLLTEVIVRILRKDIRDIKLRNVMKRDVEIGFLMLYIDTCNGFLMKTNYESKEMLRQYDLQSNGLLERPLLTFKDSEHGDGAYTDWVVAKRNDALQTSVMHKREREGREGYIVRKREVAGSSEAIIAEFKELMDNMGPVVIKM
jgi:Leucine-rich repeat (LRR) protein